MESSHLGAASLINGSLIVFRSSIKSRLGLRYKRVRRVADVRFLEKISNFSRHFGIFADCLVTYRYLAGCLVLKKWRFRAQLMSGKEQRTKHELVRFVKRSESLRYILKQYGVSVENPEENNTRSRIDDLSCEEKHSGVPSSSIDDFQKYTTELPDSVHQEKYCETVSAADYPSGQKHHNFPNLNTGALFTSLIPVFGIYIIFIIVMLHRRISRNSKKSTGRTSQGHHHHGSNTTRWRTILSDWNEQLAADEHDSLPEDREVPEEVKKVYSRVELEYQRFLSECGVSES